MSLPAGSFVLNKKASAYLQNGGEVPTMLEPGEKVYAPGQWDSGIAALNSSVPRFQQGGMVEHEHTGSGYNPSGAKDYKGRPVVLSKAAAASFSRMLTAGGVTGNDVNSSQRSKYYNSKVGGATRSNHLTGNALDMYGTSKQWMKQHGSQYGWRLLDPKYTTHDGHFDYVGGEAKPNVMDNEGKLPNKPKTHPISIIDYNFDGTIGPKDTNYYYTSIKGRKPALGEIVHFRGTNTYKMFDGRGWTDYNPKSDTLGISEQQLEGGAKGASLLNPAGSVSTPQAPTVKPTDDGGGLGDSLNFIVERFKKGYSNAMEAGGFAEAIFTFFGGDPKKKSETQQVSGSDGSQITRGDTSLSGSNGLKRSSADIKAIMDPILNGDTVGKAGDYTTYGGMKGKDAYFEQGGRRYYLDGRASEPAGGTGSVISDAKDKAVLDMIASVEAAKGDPYGGFNTSAGKTEGRATEKTIKWLADNAQGAIGRYQHMPRFLLDRAKAAGYDGDTVFTPEVQDKLTLHFLEQDTRGMYSKWKAGEISDDKMGDELSRIWRGLPHSSGGTYPDQYAGRNKAHMSRPDMIKKMKEIRGLQMGGMVMLEPGEKVFGPGQWDSSVQELNSSIPRFQTGGVTGMRGGDPNYNFRQSSEKSDQMKSVAMQPIIINGGGGSPQMAMGQDAAARVPSLPNNPGSDFASSLVMTRDLLSAKIGG